MRLAFFVNDVATEIDEYTTTRLARAAAQRGHQVWYVGLGDVELGQRNGQLMARAHAAEFDKDDTLETFLARIQDVVPTRDLWVGLIKGPVFGLIIALSGCYQGMQVEGDAEQVGRRTTSAVVQGIFLVIVLDAFFAVFFTEIGWL